MRGAIFLKQSTNFPHISDSELEIMQVIWDKGGSALFADIMADQTADNKKWKPNTVLTFLSRLVEKEAVYIVKHGRINEYVACFTADEYLTAQTKTFLNKVFGGNAKNLVASLLNKDYISPNEVSELEQYWKELKNNE